MKTGTWTHLVATYTATSATSGTLALYVNGALASTAGAGATITTAWTDTGGNLLVGAGNSGTGQFNGALDDVQVFNRALGAGEALNLFNAQKIAPVPPATAAVNPLPIIGAVKVPGCLAAGPFGTATSSAPQLVAYAAESDAYTPVTADFTYWDETAKGAATTYKAKPAVNGKAVFAMPTLAAGDRYAWYVTTDDGTTVSAATPTCRFYAPTQTVPSPVGHWTLADGSGTTAADTGIPGGDTGTLSATGVTWNSGGFGTFDGAGGSIATSGPAVDTTKSFSVSAWVNLASATSAATAVGQDGTQNSGFQLQYDAQDNKWNFARADSDVTNTPSSYRALSSAAPTLNAWTHLVGTFDQPSGTMTLYVNGAVQGTATDNSSFPAGGPLTIGRALWNGAQTDLFPGSIADVRVYSQALSATQVGWLYGNTGFVQSPTAALTAPQTAITGSTITASAAKSVAGTAPITSYSFDFGDGSGTAKTGSQTAASATHIYAAAGTYTATVTVTDANGKTATSTATIAVSAVSGTMADFNHDGHVDLAVVDPNGNLMLYPGTGGSGTNTFGSSVLLGTGFSSWNRLMVGDVNGDGFPDLLAVNASGQLWLFPGTGGTGTSTFGQSVLLGTGFDSSWTHLMLGDVNGDGKPDIVAVNSAGNMYLYPNTGGSGTNTFGASVLLGTGYDSSWTHLMLGDVNGDGKPDIVAVNSAGSMYLYPNTGGSGTNTFGSPVLLGTGWVGMSLMNLGNVSGSGRVDLLTVYSNGNMYVYPNTGGSGTGTFGSATLIGTGWGTMRGGF
ncbi:PKD repeat protein [Catenulispora sp. EB89]|uniref:LamG-like jellyroll fold domain-containing protein n=1 Tax=Catenulispora sp. EB89 TaxID=3156257 RepID=UPI003514AA8B